MSTAQFRPRLKERPRTSTSETAPDKAPSLGLFFGLAFGLTWGLAALLLLFPGPIQAVFGPLTMTNPLFILAVYSPGIAGLLLVWRHYGLAGLGRYLSRLTLWRMPWGWWAFLLLGIPALFYVGAALNGTLTDPFPFTPWYTILPAFAIALFLGPIEELGWRGLALPLLQRRMAPLWAGLLLGVVWGLWHLPAFLLSGSPQSAWSFAPYLVAVVAISVIVTPMFNAAGGSILIAAVFHFQANNPAWPDAQPWDTLVFIAAAVVITWVNRHAMLGRDHAATAIVSSGGSPDAPSGHADQQPRRNEPRFYHYPMGRVAAIIDDDRSLDQALKSLPQAHVKLADVNVLTGPEGIRLLDRRGVRRGLRSRLLRIAQLTAYEGVALDTHEQALREGHQIIYVPVRGEGEIQSVVDVLRRVGGHYLLQFRRWKVEELRF
jgi:membrane protease YdiL (CAAX protease family)